MSKYAYMSINNLLRLSIRITWPHRNHQRRHKTSTNPFKQQFQDDGRKPRTDLPILWVDCKLRCDMRGN